jgi:hypothetical protein
MLLALSGRRCLRTHAPAVDAVAPRLSLRLVDPLQQSQRARSRRLACLDYHPHSEPVVVTHGTPFSDLYALRGNLDVMTGQVAIGGHRARHPSTHPEGLNCRPGDRT